MYLFFSIRNRKFTSISPNIIQHNAVFPYCILSMICTSILSREKPGSHIPYFLIFSITSNVADL